MEIGGLTRLGVHVAWRPSWVVATNINNKPTPQQERHINGHLASVLPLSTSTRSTASHDP